MIRRLLLLCLAMGWGMVAANGAPGQTAGPVGVEVTAGLRSGQGGAYVNRGGMALDLAAVSPLRDLGAATVTGAFSVGGQTSLVRLDHCLLLEDGGCAPDFPTLLSVGALLGVQRGSARSASARLMAGPTAYQALPGGRALGVQGRLDLATPSWRSMALVGTVQRAVLPSFRGARVAITSFGVGLRVE
jgi:hypothetical protein